MRKTYASKCEVCHSTAKYRKSKFNFKYVPPPHLRHKMPFGQRIFITNIHNISKWRFGSSGNSVVEAKEINIQLKT